MARRFYTGPCRWYAGGPLGRIRYYRASPGAKILPGLNVFWPITELLDKEFNEDGPGEVINAGRRQDHSGRNNRPDLDGSHPAGSADDFAGLTKLPEVQPPDPDCSIGPGMPLNFQIESTEVRGLGDLAPGSFAVILDDAPDYPALWLAPEELTSANPGDALALWPRVPGTPRDGVPFLVPNTPAVMTDDATGWKGARLFNGVPPGPEVSQLTWDGLTLADWTILVSCRPGPLPSGFQVTNPAGTNSPLIVTPTAVFAVSAAVGGLGLASEAGAYLQLDHWCSTRLGSTWSIYRNGGRVLQANGGALPVTLGLLMGAAAGAPIGYSWVPEIAIYRRGFNPAEVLAAAQRSAEKYRDFDMIAPGTIQAFGGGTVPDGWLACDGAAVGRVAEANLFAAIGVAWGPGDGATTFNVPDLRGRALVGTSPGGLGADRPTARAIGAAGGEEVHQLSAAEMAAHVHAVTDPAHRHGLTYGQVPYTAAGPDAIANLLQPPGRPSPPPLFTDNAATGLTVASAGGDLAHNTMPPFAAAQWVIKR